MNMVYARFDLNHYLHRCMFENQWELFKNIFGVSACFKKSHFWVASKRVSAAKETRWLLLEANFRVGT